MEGVTSKVFRTKVKTEVLAIIMNQDKLYGSIVTVWGDDDHLKLTVCCDTNTHSAWHLSSQMRWHGTTSFTRAPTSIKISRLNNEQYMKRTSRTYSTRINSTGSNHQYVQLRCIHFPSRPPSSRLKPAWLVFKVSHITWTCYYTELLVFGTNCFIWSRCAAPLQQPWRTTQSSS